MANKDQNKILTWEAPEFLTYKKSPGWFVVLAVLGIALVGIFLLQRDILTAVMFALLTITASYFAKLKPKLLKIQIDGSGVKLNATKIPFKQIRSFWLIYEPPVTKTLNFETTAYLNRHLILQLGDQDPAEVREFLLDYLPEDLDKEESLTDKLARTLKF